MIPRLIALWFSVGVMWLVSASCYAIGTEYYHGLCSQDVDINVRPLIVRIFMTKEGAIYFYPAVFMISALILT